MPADDPDDAPPPPAPLDYARPAPPDVPSWAAIGAAAITWSASMACVAGVVVLMSVARPGSWLSWLTLIACVTSAAAAVIGHRWTGRVVRRDAARRSDGDR